MISEVFIVIIRLKRIVVLLQEIVIENCINFGINQPSYVYAYTNLVLYNLKGFHNSQKNNHVWITLLKNNFKTTNCFAISWPPLSVSEINADLIHLVYWPWMVYTPQLFDDNLRNFTMVIKLNLNFLGYISILLNFSSRKSLEFCHFFKHINNYYMWCYTCL